MARRKGAQVAEVPVERTPLQQAEDAVEAVNRMVEFAEKSLRHRIEGALTAIDAMGERARNSIALTMEGWTEPASGKVHAPDLPRAASGLQHHVAWAVANLNLDDLSQASTEYLQARIMLAEAERDLATLQARQ